MDDAPDTGLIPIGQVTEYAITLPGAPLYLDRLRIRVIGRVGDDTPRLCIEVTPETGIKDLESAWAMIEHWRDELQAAFPAKRLGDALRELLMAELDQRQRSGESYADLAAWITDRIDDALRAYLEWINSDDTTPGAGWLDLGHPRYGWVAAMELLRWFGPQRNRGSDPVDNKERVATLNHALDRLRNGDSAFDTYSHPSRVHAQTVTSRLRVWREKNG